jgi:hypothetical protein
MPWFTNVARTFDEQYARCTDALALLVRAAWFAIGWIAFETAVGWWLATRRPRVPAEASKVGAPPLAPPPHP